MTQNFIKISYGEGLKTQCISLKEFEESFGIRYLPHLEFADYRIERWVKKKCKEALKKGHLADYTKWLGHLHKKELEEGFVPDITLRWINEKMGYGVFTNQPIQQSAFIGKYTGILRRRNLFFANTNDYCFMYPREWLTLKPLTIDSETCGNHTRFINHHENPNLESLSIFHDGCFQIMFRATRLISAGEELTFDYGPYYWRHRKKF